MSNVISLNGCDKMCAQIVPFYVGENKREGADSRSRFAGEASDILSYGNGTQSGRGSVTFSLS